MSTPEERRDRMAAWLDRFKIIALGLTLGIGARYVVRYWPASWRPGRGAVVAPVSPKAASSAVPSPQRQS